MTRSWLTASTAGLVLRHGHHDISLVGNPHQSAVGVKLFPGAGLAEHAHVLEGFQRLDELVFDAGFREGLQHQGVLLGADQVTFLKRTVKARSLQGRGAV